MSNTDNELETLKSTLVKNSYELAQKAYKIFQVMEYRYFDNYEPDIPHLQSVLLDLIESAIYQALNSSSDYIIFERGRFRVEIFANDFNYTGTMSLVPEVWEEIICRKEINKDTIKTKNKRFQYIKEFIS